MIKRIYKNLESLNFLELLEILWQKKITIIVYGSVGVIFGLIIAFTAPKEWEAKSTLYAEQGESMFSLSGGLGGLAGLAGVDLPDGSAQALSPASYNEIIKSTHFMDSVLQKKFYFEGLGESITLDVYFKDYLKRNPLKSGIRFIGKLISGSGEDTPRTKDPRYRLITENEEKLFAEVNNRIVLEFDDENSLLEISVTMQDPEVAALIGNYVVEYLDQYLVIFNQKRKEKALSFLKEEMDKKQMLYLKANIALVEFLDANINLRTNKSQVEERRLRRENDLFYDLYITLANSYEEAKIEYNKENLSLVMINEFWVPEDESKPNKLLILFVTALFLVIIAFLRILWKEITA